ncbi:hypothetical protein [Helicobacter sp. UBA3407]|nr:hypothetical protein [Helicobacter sp. UBA3407]
MKSLKQSKIIDCHDNFTNFLAMTHINMSLRESATNEAIQMKESHKDIT